MSRSFQLHVGMTLNNWTQFQNTDIETILYWLLDATILHCYEDRLPDEYIIF